MGFTWATGHPREVPHEWVQPGVFAAIAARVVGSADGLVGLARARGALLKSNEGPRRVKVRLSASEPMAQDVLMLA